MKTNWLFLTPAAVLAAGTLAAQTTSAAQPDAQTPKPRIALQRIARQLDLTDDQKAQIKAELKPERRTLIELMARIHAGRTGLREAVRASDATEASVRVAAAKLAAAEADFAVERLKLHGKISPILTDDQRAKLAEIEQRFDRTADAAIDRARKRLGP